MNLPSRRTTRPPCRSPTSLRILSMPTCQQLWHSCHVQVLSECRPGTRKRPQVVSAHVPGTTASLRNRVCMNVRVTRTHGVAVRQNVRNPFCLAPFAYFARDPPIRRAPRQDRVQSCLQRIALAAIEASAALDADRARLQGRIRAAAAADLTEWVSDWSAPRRAMRYSVRTELDDE